MDYQRAEIDRDKSFAERWLFVFMVVFGLGIPSLADYRLPGGTLMGPHTGYDYAPTMMQVGSLQKFWWCGNGYIPGTATLADVIYYRTIDLSTGAASAYYQVLSPTPGTWDGVNTCDPSVIQGSFYNPDNGATYSFAMYYTGDDNLTNGGNNNRIGVAFSNDGISWIKYSGNPVIYPQVYPTSTYGAGQPATYSNDHLSNLTLFYMDQSTGVGTRVWIRTTNDAVHFSTPTLVSNEGVTTQQFGNSDFGYDAQSGYFYGLLDQTARSGDREAYTIGFYRMPAYQLLAGQGVWEFLGQVDTNLTGFYLNHSPGILRDPFGNVTPWLPSVEAYFSEGSNTPSTWDLTWAILTPQPSTLAFKRYYSQGLQRH